MALPTVSSGRAPDEVDERGPVVVVPEDVSCRRHSVGDDVEETVRKARARHARHLSTVLPEQGEGRTRGRMRTLF
jgi:hypothetical protein